MGVATGAQRDAAPPLRASGSWKVPIRGADALHAMNLLLGAASLLACPELVEWGADTGALDGDRLVAYLSGTIRLVEYARIDESWARLPAPRGTPLLH